MAGEVLFALIFVISLFFGSLPHGFCLVLFDLVRELAVRLTHKSETAKF